MYRPKLIRNSEIIFAIFYANVYLIIVEKGYTLRLLRLGVRKRRIILFYFTINVLFATFKNVFVIDDVISLIRTTVWRVFERVNEPYILYKILSKYFAKQN